MKTQEGSGSSVVIVCKFTDLGLTTIMICELEQIECRINDWNGMGGLSVFI